MNFHSIRWQLQIWHGIILLAVLTGFGFTVYRLQSVNELRRVDQGLRHRLGALHEALRGPLPGPPGRPPGAPGSPSVSDPRRIGEPRPGDEDFNGLDRRGPPPPRFGDGEWPPPPRDFRLGPNRAGMFEGETNAFYYVVWLRDGRELSRSATALGEIPQPVRPTGRVSGPTGRSNGMIREFFEYTPPGECLLVGRSIAPELANQHQLAIWVLGLGGAVLVFGLAGGGWLATRAIRPIDLISVAAARIADGDLTQRINISDTANELGQLAGVLNSTFDRLEAAFARQQQFTADAAHELRTPIAVILAQTQATLARDRRSEEYRETLGACQRAALRMRDLTESLLKLARLDSEQEKLHRSRIDLTQVVQECVALMRPLASEHQVTLRCDLTLVECWAEPGSLSQVITNLLSNAIKYNLTGGEVRVTLRKENGVVLLEVADTGPGIPAQQLPRIFERFYRADESRTGGSGGTGLGLAICIAIVEKHDGTLDVSSQPGVGTVFSVRLPQME